jgi:hypothetical protein
VIANELVEVDPIAGVLTTTVVTLSQRIVFGPNRDDANGVFSGWGFAVFHTGQEALHVDLSNGTVSSLGMMAPINPGERGCSWAIFGVAESFGDHIYLVHPVSARAPFSPAPPTRTVKRHRVPDGATAIIATFADLGSTCQLMVAPTLDRWYFAGDGTSQIGGTLHWVAGCEATFAVGGGDGIVPFPGVAKYPFEYRVGSVNAGSALASSFVVSELI